MTAHRPIVIATKNPGKLREIRAILEGLPFRWLGLDQFSDLPEAVESEETFYDNALIKATHFSRLTGHWALADDSGLEVDALGGAPGVYSSRYAGSGADDQANNDKLLAALAAVEEPQRTARFRCCVVLADGQHPIATAAGTVEGQIALAPRGDNGFGYDPLFFLPEYGKTAAELAPELKNSISHRARALAQLREHLAGLAG